MEARPLGMIVRDPVIIAATVDLSPHRRLRNGYGSSGLDGKDHSVFRLTYQSFSFRNAAAVALEIGHNRIAQARNGIVGRRNIHFQSKRPGGV
jgi:hypothetical protein